MSSRLTMVQTVQTGFLCLALLGLSAALVCPDGGMCEDRNTCCRNTEGRYGCCPLPRAECCSDHLHCCYEGTVCDLVHARCVNKTVSLPWMTRLPTKQLSDQVKAVICPDQESECPDSTTCCQLPDGSWGCCPLAKAVCCQDNRHCCPEGSKCDLTHSKCVSASQDSVPMLEKLPARRRNPPVGSVTCPGGRSSCPDSHTCCLLTSGDYGCCPYVDAMCCSDHLHCCPSNTVCDLEAGVCRSSGTHVPLLKKMAALPNDVQCPDKTSVCPDQTTCCQMTNGTYGCCPMPDAVCCSDHLHCCPSGTECDLYHSTCVSAQGHTAMSRKIPAAAARLLAVKVKASGPSTDTETSRWPANVFSSPSPNTKCDNITSCPGDYTCCTTLGGAWACCPLPQAVCCDDHIHCCPNGMVCNLEGGTCDDPWSSARSVSWVMKVPALRSEARGEKCDAQTMCPKGTTCCQIQSGQWACCPLPQAVCCSDHQHCCPKGYKCNVAEQTCDKPGGLLRVPWHHKILPLQAAAARTRTDNNMCDAQTSCPRDTTCCFMNRTHKWGCCPLPKAVCCEDGSHCCPSGHTCEPHRSSCSRGPHVIPWFTKVSALKELGALTDVKCDNKSSCASGTTCCKLQTGGWGCCPLVKAVCCADEEHCCPQGYTCNMQTGTCEKKEHATVVSTLPQSQVVQSDREDTQDDTGVPCDGTGEFHCSQQETCCQSSGTEWSCCPSPRAVCCSDSRRCCPEGSSCDLKGEGCVQNSQLTWASFFGHRKKDFAP